MLTAVELGKVGGRDALQGCLLHGFGAGAQDLVPLSAELGTSVGAWLVPHAPVPIKIAGMSYGRAWFPRSADEMEKALFGGYFQVLRSLEPDGLAIAAHEVMALLADRGVDTRRLVLGGFSQGAMVAAEIVRQSLRDGAPLPAAVLLFSGALVAERWWGEVADAADAARGDRDERARIWWAHGTGDSVLPYGEGVALADAIERAGLPVERCTFDGGHEIPAPAVAAARAFLTRL